MSIFALATDVRQTQYQGGVGDWAAHGDHDRWATGLNQAPQAKQITTTTVSDPGDGNNVTITIDAGLGAVAITVSATGLDASGIAAALVTAINNEPRIRANVIASSVTTTLTLTGLTPGLAFTATESDASLTTPSTTQAAASAEAIPCGRALISQGPNPGRAEELVALAKSSLLTAQVATLAFGAFVSGQVNTIYVYEVRGAERQLIASVSEAAATDRDTTVDALVALLTTALTGKKVSVAADNATATAIVFTATAAGYEFDVEYLAGHEGATLQSLALAYTTGPSASTSIHRALAGVSLRPQDEEIATSTATEPEWPANRGVRHAKQGQLFVESAEAITAGAPVFLELGVSADNGQCFLTDSTTRVQLPRALVHWMRDGNVAADNLGVVRLNIP